jgi:flagellar P-ring protein precursor FlgI
VIATAELPPFSKNGDRISVRLSTLGDAKSLAGGTLLLTPLEGGDQKVYALAQGGILGGNSPILTVATLPEGGVIERDFEPFFGEDNTLVLSLKEGDFVTNYRTAKKINQHFKGFYAKSLSLTGIQVTIPPQYQDQLVSFIAALESLDVETDQKAVIAINEKTGTIAIGHMVQIEPVTIAHGALSISVQNKPSSLVQVSDLIKGLNDLGAKPQDVIDILRTLHRAGAIHAKLEIL